jgi:ATP-dependent Clp protease ATP-binding subunit ClpC
VWMRSWFFDTLGKKELAQIVDKLLAEMQVRLGEMGLHLKASAAAKAKLLAVGMDVRYGARPLRRALRKNVEDKLADLYLSGVFGRGDTVNLDVVGGEFAFTQVENTPEDVCVPLGEEVVHGQS